MHRHQSVHAGAVILVGKAAQFVAAAIGITKYHRRMLYAIEHVGLYRSIMVHILKPQTVADTQRTGEAPIAHIIPAQA